MEKNFKRTLITAALPYANGPVHIGHLAGVYIPSDIYARYLRLRGEEVLFVCGSDEHGVPIAIKAKKEGCDPHRISFDRYDGDSSASHLLTSVSPSIPTVVRRAPRTVSFASSIFRTIYDKGRLHRRRERAVLRSRGQAVPRGPLHHGYLPSLSE